jgi:hypothetical protein
MRSERIRVKGKREEIWRWRKNKSEGAVTVCGSRKEIGGMYYVEGMNWGDVILGREREREEGEGVCDLC